uniref:Uncharacterized protein n=1 Tax=Arundo donax TaxID=35708 RepID=A0A0A9GXT5_ARUDO
MLVERKGKKKKRIVIAKNGVLEERSYFAFFFTS